MEGKWVAAAYMKNRDRFAGGNRHVSAIGKHANNNKKSLSSAITDRFILNLTEVHANFMDCRAHPQSTLNLWIHEHGKGFMDTVGVRNLVLNLVQQHRRHICEVLEYMYDI
jgi:hypothetical protein